jgi:DNA-directed RNA polymerase subunit RPC12/RpoP
MGNEQNGGFDSFLAFGIGDLIIFLTLWVILAVVAYAVAPDDRRWTFVGLTLLLLGPLGVAAAAAVAQSREPAYAAPPRRPVAAKRRRFICPRCGAENDIPESDRSYECWRCSEQRKVEPLTKETKPAKTAPAGTGST